MNRFIPTAVALAALAAPAPARDDWASDSVFYLAFVRSYADSTEGPLAGDGVGDIRGMIERLDYLNDGDPSTDTDLGVTGLWLLPIAQSPSYHGYDTTDYYAVDDEYGTMDDFKELLAACRARGIRVVFDLVLNHTSDQHPWFVESMDRDSDKRDWYVWRDPKPEYAGPWGQPVWHDHWRDPAGAFYYGCFYHGMPDLNYQSDAVSERMLDVTRFWLDEVGVDGFRLDAIKHLIEEGENQSSTDATVAWLRDFNAFCNEIKGDAWVVGEVWAGADEIARYLPSDEHPAALDSCFDFPLSYAITEGLRDGNAARIRGQLADSWSLHGTRASTFLSNHDTTRTMSVLDGDEGKARAAATLLLTAPGTPFLYYGEEIGMIGTKPDPNLRTPMHWTRDADTAGFTTGTPWRGPQVDIRARNVERQQADASSLWSHYRDLIRVRRDHEALRRGSYQPVDAGDERLVAFIRERDGRRLLVLVNASDDAVRPYGFDAAALGLESGWTSTEILGGRETQPVPDGRAWKPFRLLRPHGSWIIDLGLR